MEYIVQESSGKEAELGETIRIEEIKENHTLVEDDVIIDDPLDIRHMTIKYYIEEIIDDITLYHKQLNYDLTGIYTKP